MLGDIDTLLDIRPSLCVPRHIDAFGRQDGRHLEVSLNFEVTAGKSNLIGYPNLILSAAVSRPAVLLTY